MMRTLFCPRLELSVGRKELSQSCQRLRQFLTRYALPAKIIYDVELVLEEMAGNVIRYGKTDGQILVTVEIHSRSILIHIIDKGIPFDPIRVLPPNIPETMDKAAHGGFGIHMVRSVVDHMRYRRIGEENRLEIRIDRHPPRGDARGTRRTK